MFDSGLAQRRSLGYYYLYLLSLAAIIAHVHGIEAPWPSATATPSADQRPMAEWMGFSPKPTEPPRIRGRMAADALFARADTDNAVFCGYVSANPSSPVACADFRRICMFNTVIGAVGCCENVDAPAESCSQYTSCVNRRDVSSCAGGCSANPLVVTCSDTASPSCWTYAWITGMSSLGCGASSFSASVAVTYLGQVRTTAASTAASTTATSTPASGGSSDGGGANIGAIAGGAVGGLAVLMGLIVGLVYFLPKFRRKQAEGGEKGGAPPQMPTQQQWMHDPSVYSSSTATPMYGAPPYSSPLDENSPLPKVGAYHGQNAEHSPLELAGNARSELPSEPFDPPSPPPPLRPLLQQEPAREPGATLFPPPAS